VLVELIFVVEPIEIFEQMFPPPVPISKLLIEPVTPREPVISADPVKGKPTPPLPVLTVIGNVVPLPLVNVIVFVDTDAVVIAFRVKDEVEAKLELKEYEELTTNEAVLAYEALKAYEALTTYEAVVAKLELKAYEELTANEEVVAFEALKAYEELTTYEAVVAKLELKAYEELTVKEDV